MKRRRNFPVIREAWPRVTHFPRYYMVDGRLKGNRGRREYFVDRKAALSRADQLAQERENEGTRALEFTTRDRAMFAECREMLAPFSRTLRDAATFYVQHLKREQRQVPTIREAAALYIEAKRADAGRGELAPRSLREYKRLMTVFIAACGDERIDDFDVEKLRTYINSFSHVGPKTRANLRLRLGVFFSFCRQKKWIQTNPAQEMTVKVPRHDVVVLSVSDCERLLRVTQEKHPHMLSYITVCLFAGLRPFEAQQLSWEQVNDDHIEVLPHTSKKRERRFVTIEPTLAAWLQPCRRKSGRILPDEKFQRLFATLLANAGYDPKSNPWPADAMRHSYASYWLAKYQNRAALAELMGNSVEVIRKHYRQPITKEQCERFWALRPTR